MHILQFINMRLVDLGPFLPTLLALGNSTLWLQHVYNTLISVTRVYLSLDWSSKYSKLKAFGIPQRKEPYVKIGATYLSNQLIDNLADTLQDVFRARSSIFSIFIALSFLSNIIVFFSYQMICENQDTGNFLRIRYFCWRIQSNPVTIYTLKYHAFGFWFIYNKAPFVTILV